MLANRSVGFKNKALLLSQRCEFLVRTEAILHKPQGLSVELIVIPE